MSRQEFEVRFPDDDACARYLAERRWPDGFVCPACGGRKGWALDRGRPTWECAACRRQTSVTAGTIMHRSHLALKTWFLAAHIVATHSNGISALQLQGQLGIGSYKTAWLLLHKLRRAMVDPGRSLLQTLVEIDETEMPLRSKNDSADRKKGGRSAVGKICQSARNTDPLSASKFDPLGVVGFGSGPTKWSYDGGGSDPNRGVRRGF